MAAVLPSTGDDTNPCTRAAPCRSLERAASAGSPRLFVSLTTLSEMKSLAATPAGGVNLTPMPGVMRKLTIVQFSTNRAAPFTKSIPVAPKLLTPFMERFLSLTEAPAASILNTKGEEESPASAPAQSIVIDLLISTEPKSPLSTQLISPPALVLSCAVCSAAHGAARLQLLVARQRAAPPPGKRNRPSRSANCRRRGCPEPRARKSRAGLIVAG
jgi:hypothetical protein